MLLLAVEVMQTRVAAAVALIVAVFAAGKVTTKRAVITVAVAVVAVVFAAKERAERGWRS